MKTTLQGRKFMRCRWRNVQASLAETTGTRVDGDALAYHMARWMAAETACPPAALPRADCSAWCATQTYQ
eukprot:3114170-Pleurochrysis_carterae.AAC.1